MKSILQKLASFWFRPIAPERLSILRLITGGFSLWYLLARYEMFQKIAQSELSLYDPVGLATLLSEPLSFPVFKGLLLLTIGLNILYILGWKFRFTGPLFALSLMLLMCYRNSWSMIYHNYNGLVMHVMVIGFTAAADTLSIDAWRQKGTKWLEEVKPDWQYGWPILLICTLTVITYVLAGFAKIYGDLAWDWMSGEAMRSQVAVDAIRKNLFGSQASPLFEWIYPHTSLFLMMGIMTMILELGAPLALLNQKIGYIWALLTCSMHWGIYFIMGIHFPYQMGGFIFLAFFPLERLWFMARTRLIKAKLIAQ